MVPFDYNTAFRRQRRIKDTLSARRSLPSPTLGDILRSMTAAEDLARRYLALWEDYVTAVLADLAAPEALQHRAAGGSARAGDPGSGDRTMCGQHPGPEPTAGSATAPGSPRECHDAVADLAGRLARIEERVAALERRRPAAARARGGN